MIKKVKEFFRILHLLRSEKLVDALCASLMASMESTARSIRLVKNLMKETGVDLSMDMRNDETGLRRMQEVFQMFVRYTSPAFKNGYTLEDFRRAELSPPDCMIRASTELEREAKEIKKGVVHESDKDEQKGRIIRPKIWNKESE